MLFSQKNVWETLQDIVYIMLAECILPDCAKFTYGTCMHFKKIISCIY